MEKINILAISNIKLFSKKDILGYVKNYSIDKLPKLNRKEFGELVNKIIVENKNISKSKSLYLNDFEISNAFNKAKKIVALSDSQDIKIISIFDDLFPRKLKQIMNPPLILHYKGNIKNFNRNSVAIVGTRKPTNISRRNSREATKFFVKNKFTIVSGLALGIDSEVHKSCLEQNGKTIAILPSSLDYIAPKSNTMLSQQILEKGGMLLSEYPIHTAPKKFTYVERDRLQSGISSAVIIIETGNTGGTMYTARFALKQNKIVAVFYPNDEDLFSRFSGNIKLIDNGKSIIINNINDFKNVIKKISISEQVINNKYDQLFF